MHCVVPDTLCNKPLSHFLITIFVSFCNNCITLWYQFFILCWTFKKDNCRAWEIVYRVYGTFSNFFCFCEKILKGMHLCTPFSQLFIVFVFIVYFNWEICFHDRNKKIPVATMYQIKCISLKQGFHLSPHVAPGNSKEEKCYEI